MKKYDAADADQDQMQGIEEVKESCEPFAASLPIIKKQERNGEEAEIFDAAEREGDDQKTDGEIEETEDSVVTFSENIHDGRDDRKEDTGDSVVDTNPPFKEKQQDCHKQQSGNSLQAFLLQEPDRIEQQDREGKGDQDIAEQPAFNDVEGDEADHGEGKYPEKVSGDVPGVTGALIDKVSKEGKCQPTEDTKPEKLGKELIADVIQCHGKTGDELQSILIERKSKGFPVFHSPLPPVSSYHESESGTDSSPEFPNFPGGYEFFPLAFPGRTWQHGAQEAKTRKKESRMDELREECGVFGIWSPEKKDLGRLAYYGLLALQHRGQEAAGIAVSCDREICCQKDIGLVSNIFDETRLQSLGQGNMVVAHVRYATQGAGNVNNAQPIVVHHRKGNLALCHNGNLVNSQKLRRELEDDGCIFHMTSDTEVISYLITRERIHCGSIEEAVLRIVPKIHGAFSIIMMSPTKLIALRDPRGFRPLCYGVTVDGAVVFASESCALDSVGARFVRDFQPGEMMVCDGEGLRSDMSYCNTEKRSLCIFEYIYFARPDSVIDGISVHEARIHAGHMLARDHQAEADVVVGVPDSGLDAALGYSQESGIPYGIGLLKNKYVGRTFIAPGQEYREQLVRIKLNPIAGTVRGKRVILIDDSIVRGTTSAHIVRLIREAGAKEVHMRISSPPFLNPCYYGTDIDSRENLIACHHSVEETARIIGADSLGYLSMEHASDIAGGGDGFCKACFDGKYAVEN